MAEMNSNLIAFQFEAIHVRTIVDENGNPWFIVKDVLAAMGSASTTTQAINSINQTLGEGFVNNIPLQTAGGVQDTTIIAEAATTFLISRSNTEQGKRMNRWIHVDVLPEIRKKGVYSRELTREEILVMALESERERKRLLIENEQLAKDNEEMKPKADYHDRLLGYQETFDADYVAKLLKTSKPKLFTVLRKNKVFMKNKNVPMQRFIDRGFMVIKPTEYKDQFGIDRVSLTTEFTQTGIQYTQTLVDRFFE